MFYLIKYLTILWKCTKTRILLRWGSYQQTTDIFLIKCALHESRIYSKHMYIIIYYLNQFCIFRSSLVSTRRVSWLWFQKRQGNKWWTKLMFSLRSARWSSNASYHLSSKSILFSRSSLVSTKKASWLWLQRRQGNK